MDSKQDDRVKGIVKRFYDSPKQNLELQEWLSQSFPELTKSVLKGKIWGD